MDGFWVEAVRGKLDKLRGGPFRLRRVFSLRLMLILLTPLSVWGQTIDPASFQAFEGRTVTAIVFEGNKVTKEYVLKRELEIQIGAPLAFETLEQDLLRLHNLGIFGSVSVAAEDDGIGVRLLYEVRELPPIIPIPVIMYSQQNGLSGGGGAAATNLSGRNAILVGHAVFGGTTNFALRYRDPWIKGNHLSLDVKIEHLERFDTMNDFNESSNWVTPWVGTYIGRYGRLGGTASYAAVASDVDGKTLSSDNKDELFTMGGYVGYDSRDSYRDPHQGWNHRLELLYTGATADFLTAKFDVRRYQPTRDRQTLVLGAFAALQSGTVGVDLPGYFQYYMGGSNSIRGYTLDHLGPELNGKNQFIGTIEYQYGLMPLRSLDIRNATVDVGLQLALFVDTGTAWTEGSQFGWERFKTGFGGGFRVLLPVVEMLRFDVGYSLDQGFVFNFGIKSKLETQASRIR